MRILAVDLGKARTGLAISDQSGMLASPAGVVHQTDTQKLVQEISDKAKGLGAQRLVVGYPRNMDGSEGERAQECAAVAKELERISGIQTVLWDERCTTLSAHTLLNATNTRGKKRKAIVDAVAACVILEDYLRSLS